MAEKAADIRAQTSEQLHKRQQELHDQLFKLRFQIATGQNENPSRIRVARRELARVKTILTERRGAEAKRVAQPAAAKE